MSLTSENYFRTNDPLFGARTSGVIAAQTRSDRLALGYSLGDVVRAESGIPLPTLEEPTHAPSDEELSHEAGFGRSTVMRNIITGETHRLGEMQDNFRARLAAEHAGPAAVAGSAQMIQFEQPVPAEELQVSAEIAEVA